MYCTVVRAEAWFVWSGLTQTQRLSGDYGSALRLLMAFAWVRRWRLLHPSRNLVGARAVRCDKRSGGSPPTF